MDAPTSGFDLSGAVAAAAAFEQGVEPKLVVTLDGEVITANAAARRSLDGVSAGATSADWHAGPEESLLGILRDAAGANTPMPYTLQVRQAGRLRRRPCWLCRLPGEEPIQVMVQFRELAVAGANFRRLSEELQASVSALARERQLRADLESAYESVDRFAAVAAHDLRAPLHHMASYVALLRRALGEHLEERHLHWIEQVESSAVRLGGMINDLLEHARTGRHEVQLLPVDLDALLDQILEDHAETLGEITLQREPLPRLLADRTLLHVVLQNLVQNALKYRSPDRPLHLTIRARTHADGSTEVQIVDNGIGFGADDAEAIFRPFQRAGNVDGREGSGIGLATCRQATEKLGWSLSATGRPDAGATFRLLAPPEADPRHTTSV